MFKLESYITPLLLSYVDKYIKNFRAEDSQVSLWGGDVSFNNLDLRLEVLENELQLPFTFVSGHIHELLIHVPWTKITSEPITITINTIECILKLKGPESIGSTVPKDMKKCKLKHEQVEAAPGYIQTVINKIVGNIRLYCNNLILKYVEDDIVLSMNIKLLTFESANNNWEPAYTDIPHGEVTLRKLININDLTICLDKRNSAGKIEIYQEPVLYRCSMTVRLLRSYFAPTIKKTSVTRADIHCTNMEFSMNEQQVPMVMRIINLIIFLIRREYKQEPEFTSEPCSTLLDEFSENKLTWAGWAWSVLPSFFPSNWDDEYKQEITLQGHTLHFGFFVDNASLTLKVSESSQDRGYYNQKKMKYWPVMHLNINGVFYEFIYHGKQWSNSTFGISEVLLYPVGFCTCSQPDVVDPENAKEFLRAGSRSDKHLLNSLFDESAPGNINEKRKYTISWEQHMNRKTVTYLLDTSPAFVLDSIHHIQLPDDMTVSDINIVQDFLNFKEDYLVRVVVGHFKLSLCSGFSHRLSTFMAATNAYDYQPYTNPKPTRLFHELQPPSEDDFDSFNERITMKTLELTIINPVIELELIDHPYFTATKENYFRPRKRGSITSANISNVNIKNLPKLTLECQCLTATFTSPFYDVKLVSTTCQLPDPPLNMFNACHKERNIKINGICSRLILGSNNKCTTIVTPTNATYYTKSIIHPEYWLSDDVIHETVLFTSDTISFTGTNPKLTLAIHILRKILNSKNEEYDTYLKNSSLFQDAARDYSMTYLEFGLESVNYKMIKTNIMRAFEIKIGSLKSFIYNPIDVSSGSSSISTDEDTLNNRDNLYFATRDIEQVMFITSSEKDTNGLSEFVNVVIQLPLTPDRQSHPPIVIFKVEELKICFDPLFCKWLLYTPTVTLQKTELSGSNLAETYDRKLKSDFNLIETPRKLITPRESVHSSSDREHIIKPKPIPLNKEETPVDIQERIYNFLKKWFNVWKGLILYGDVHQCIIHFPIESLSAVGFKGMHETIDQAISGDKPPEILVITLPKASIKCNSTKTIVMDSLKTFLIKLPHEIWNVELYTFPWTLSITDICIYTLQYGKKFNLLKPTSISATVALSTNEPNSLDNQSNISRESLQQQCYTSINIETFGLCVYVDISPIEMFCSEAQIYLLSSIIYGLTEVIFNRISTVNVYQLKFKERSKDSVMRMSPVLFGDPSRESTSENDVSDNSHVEVSDRDTQKLTAWVQSTINKFTLTILSHQQAKKMFLYKQKPELKLVFDAEDIVSSLDFQNVYLKIKSKIGSASINHYTRPTGLLNFVKGPFLGIIMRAREPTQDKTQDDTCFANITITRANCKHTHGLWGTIKKNKKENNALKPSHFITEIVFTLQPIDFILPPSVIVKFLTVFQPLTQITTTLSKSKKKYEHNIKFNNKTLPLTYFELKGFQFIFPTDNNTCIHDMAILQIDSITLNPNPENPICRTPKRADLYEKAAQARLLNIPGSDLEDRQYQLDINKISFSTGRWKDLRKLFENLDIETPLKTMSENPALEWNNLGNESKTKQQHYFRLWPFIEKFDLMIIAAPAMVYNTMIVCNHSVEINFVSDIDLNLCLSHFDLLSILMKEIKQLHTIFGSKEYEHPKVIFPYESFYFLPAVVFDETASVDTKDSGFDAEVKSSTSLKDYQPFDTSRVHILQETDKLFKVVSKPVLFTITEPKVSVEVLITAGKISLIISNLTHLKNTNGKSSNVYNMKTKSSLLNAVTTLEPILYVALSQPNCYYSDTELGQRIQLSCFDVCVKINSPELEPIDMLPTAKNFSINLLETRTGIPDNETGILPSMFTIKWAKGVTKLSTLDVQLSKPTKILFSIDRCECFIVIYNKLMQEFFDNTSDTISAEVYEEPPKELILLGGREKRLRFYDQYERFKEIKRILFGLSYINIDVSQIVVAVKTIKNIELTMSVGEVNYNITVNNRPERITFVLKFDYLTLGISQGTWKKLLLNPWSLSTEIILFWEPWQDEDSDPQIQVAIESDTIMIDISSQQITSMHVFYDEITEFMSHYFTGEIEITAPVKTCVNESSQYYKDDLRAGAFQFIDAQTNNINELPLPYQVVFWTKNASIMAWRYPQPRVLTKVRVFPVPFKVTGNDVPAVQILCHLEYWSDCYNCYQPYAKFYLSETEMCHLDVPLNEPKPIIACTWRVLLMSVTINDDKTKRYSSTRVPISPHVLAGCIRIDSYFSRILVPDLIILMNISSINVSLYSSIDKDNYTMPECLKEYNCDLTLPENQCFLTLSIQNVKAYLSSWNLESMMLDCTTDIGITMLDYTFLTKQTLIEPFNARIQFSYANKISCNFASKPIRLRFGASTAHTLFVSTQLWNQKFYATPETSKELVIITPYVICNNCNFPLKFGQTGYEEMYLPTRYCHLYAWRSQKCKKMLRVAIEDDNFWVWSEPFRIDKEGTQMLKLNDQHITIIVTVKALSTTQYNVTFSGQFCIYNMLLEHFEFKVVEAVVDKDVAFKNAQKYLINGKSSPPTILLNTKKKYHLRIRFFGLDSAWSGDIPLQENTKSAQPWLVKVPLQERGQFLSIWCRILVQQYPKGNKILAVLWPLFMIRSNLPVNSKIQIETPTLNVQLESTINGKGEHQQLYCPGTIDHSHQITLQLDDNATTLNPYVPLNYSLVDQRSFFKRPETCKIDEIIEVIKNFDLSEWPYFGEDVNISEYVVGDQPLTHVQVKYQNACQYSSTLLVELLPWCLLLNTLGCQIGIIINGQEICRVDHYGLVTPPKLEETFHIGVGLGKTWNMSLPLQLARSDWGQVFYMPKITGTIPLEGFIKTVVKCGPYICSMLFTSCLKNEIRLLRVCSTHVITNHLHKEIHVVCFAVPDNKTTYKVPSKLENHSLQVIPNLHKKNIGVSIVQWYAIGNNVDLMEHHTELALYVAISFVPTISWSCPVRVDKDLTRRSICMLTPTNAPFPVVLTCTELDGQSVLSIHQDNHPQLEIRNNSGIKLFFVQCEKYEKTVINDCEHFNWICSVENGRKMFYTLPLVSNKFPEIHSQVSNDFIIIASDPEGDPQGYQWSNPINITVTEQFVRIPFFGDVKIISESETHTIVLNIESVSQTEINARDIRVRLSQHEKEMDNTEGSVQSLPIVSETEDINIRQSNSNASIGSSYVTAQEEQFLEIQMTSFMGKVPTEQSSLSLDEYGIITDFKTTIYMESLIFILTNDLENGGVEKTEIVSLTCDNVAFKIVGKDVSEISLCINEIQMDNQMYQTASYDFSVILIGQDVEKCDDELSIHSPIQSLFDRTGINPLLKIEMTLERLKNVTLKSKITHFKDVRICIKPIALYIEDTYMLKLLDHLIKMLPTNLIMWPKSNVTSIPLVESRVKISPAIILVSSMLANPLILSSLCIEPLSISLSIHSSKKLYIALDQSPLQFSQFERKSILTTPYRLGHTLAMHYLSGAIFGAGWVVGSLELLGSPGALARAMGTGLKDFVSMPCNGLLQGPWAFLKGVTHGSASLMKHVTAGTLQSVTKLASSVARNLDRLTLDEEHLRRTEEQRRQKPQGVTQGFLQGLTGLGISLLGAIGGIAHHPLQSIVSDGPSTSNLITGVGLGIVGIFTKPLSGAADLVALTGQGLLQGAGWNTLPQTRMSPLSIHMYSSPNTDLKYIWKYGLANTIPEIIYATEATCISNGQYESVALILMLDNLLIASIDEDMPQKTLKLSELCCSDVTIDPTLITLRLKLAQVEENKTEVDDDEDGIIEMDATSRARVADYVRSTIGLLHFPEHLEVFDEITTNLFDNSEQILSFYVNPINRNYFISLLQICKQQKMKHSFPIY